MSIAIIVPSYNQFHYVTRLLKSLEKHTNDYVVYFIDDASPDWSEQVRQDVEALLPQSSVVHRYDENDGCTRSWNYGLQLAKQDGHEYAVIANSDTIVGKGWWDGFEKALQRFSLVGPVSNAPGGPHYSHQQVKTYLPDYEVRDSTVDATAARLVGNDPVQGRINGFFMAAKTADWWRNKFDDSHVFNPAKKLLGNEDELQDRWRGTIGVATESFIFHYRSASRDTKKISPRFLVGSYRPKIAVYTANLGDYDDYQYQRPADGVDYILYADTNAVYDGIQCRRVSASDDPQRAARKIKTLSQDVGDYEYTIWMDANATLRCHPFQLIDLLGDADFAALRHPQRSCTYDEARAVLRLRYDNEGIVNQQMARYKSDGFPTSYGLAETRVVVRRNNAIVNRFNNDWHNEVVNGSRRDQLSCMYCLWRNNVNWRYLDNDLITVRRHAKPHWRAK